MTLEHLFDIEMQYEGPIELAPLGLPQGKLVGGGKGRVEGPALRGTIRWTNYERTGTVGVCALQVAAVIETDDGAEIRFKALGHAQMSEASQPYIWRVAAALRFETEHTRYRQWNRMLAVWDGVFDLRSGRARHSVYGRAEGRGKLNGMADAMPVSGRKS